jgi:uncharacterized protein YpmS
MIFVMNPKYRLISLALTLVVFVVIYFTVIKSSNDQANSIIKSTNQTVQRAESTAAKLEACMASAGNDASKISQCQSKFTP